MDPNAPTDPTDPTGCPGWCNFISKVDFNPNTSKECCLDAAGNSAWDEKAKKCPFQEIDAGSPADCDDFSKQTDRFTGKVVSEIATIRYYTCDQVQDYSDSGKVCQGDAKARIKNSHLKSVVNLS